MSQMPIDSPEGRKHLIDGMPDNTLYLLGDPDWAEVFIKVRGLDLPKTGVMLGRAMQTLQFLANQHGEHLMRQHGREAAELFMASIRMGQMLASNEASGTRIVDLEPPESEG